MNVEIEFRVCPPTPSAPPAPNRRARCPHKHNERMYRFSSYMDDGTFLRQRTYKELGKMLSSLIAREDGKEMFWAVAEEADRRHPRGFWPLREGIPNSCFLALISLFE